MQTATPNSWTSWPLVMNRGFTGTTRKPRRSRHSGNIHYPRGQNRQGNCGARSKWCWPFTFTPVGCCITSTHHKAITLTKNTNRKSFVVFVMQSCGQRERGRCIMTTHHLIPRNWFLGKTQHPSGSTGSLFSRHGSLRFWLFPRLKTQLKGIDLNHETTLYLTRR